MVRIDGNSILGGEVHKHALDSWEISWESKGEYRHWCIQRHAPEQRVPILVVMQNPGSLSGKGENLRKDTTLRILREVFQNTKAYPVILNLFDFASSKQIGLFDKWDRRDGQKLIYDLIDYSQFSGVMYAYGTCADHPEHSADILKRIKEVERACANLKEIDLLRNVNGSPKHPMTYQRQRLKPDITRKINEFLLS